MPNIGQTEAKIAKPCSNCGHPLIIPIGQFEPLAELSCPECSELNYASHYIRMDIGLSELCNLRCNMCRRPQEKTSIPFDQVVTTIRDAERIGIKTISFSGGEPFVWPGFRELLEAISTINVDVELVTNGTLIKEEDIKSLERLSCVTISIDGSRDIHDFIRGSNGAWDKSMLAIALLSGSKAKWGVNVVVQDKNSNDLWQLWRQLRKVGRPAYISFNFVEVIPETSHLQPSSENLEVAMSSIRKIRAECERDYIHFNDPEYHGDNSGIFADKARRYRPIGGCNIPKRFIGYSQFGYFPCWHQGRSIPEGDLISALKSDLCASIVKEAIDRRCVGCNAANYSWDEEWTNGVIQAHQKGEFLLGGTYLSEEEQREGRLSESGRKLPIFKRLKHNKSGIER